MVGGVGCEVYNWGSGIMLTEPSYGKMGLGRVIRGLVSHIDTPRSLRVCRQHSRKASSGGFYVIAEIVENAEKPKGMKNNEYL